MWCEIAVCITWTVSVCEWMGWKTLCGACVCVCECVIRFNCKRSKFFFFFLDCLLQNSDTQVTTGYWDHRIHLAHSHSQRKRLLIKRTSTRARVRATFAFTFAWNARRCVVVVVVGLRLVVLSSTWDVRDERFALHHCSRSSSVYAAHTHTHTHENMNIEQAKWLTKQHAITCDFKFLKSKSKFNSMWSIDKVKSQKFTRIKTNSWAFQTVYVHVLWANRTGSVYCANLSSNRTSYCHRPLTIDVNKNLPHWTGNATKCYQLVSVWSQKYLSVSIVRVS